MNVLNGQLKCTNTLDPVAEATEKLRALMERLNAIEPQVSTKYLQSMDALWGSSVKGGGN